MLVNSHCLIGDSLTRVPFSSCNPCPSPSKLSGWEALPKGLLQGALYPKAPNTRDYCKHHPPQKGPQMWPQGALAASLGSRVHAGYLPFRACICHLGTDEKVSLTDRWNHMCKASLAHMGHPFLPGGCHVWAPGVHLQRLWVPALQCCSDPPLRGVGESGNK